MKRTFLPLALTLLLASCSSDPPKTPEEAFWTWFSSNAETFQELFAPNYREAMAENPALQEGYDASLQEIIARLEAVNPAFSPFIGGPMDDPTREIIITVFGEAEHFDAVDAFVDSAPEIPGWTVIALKPAQDANPGIVIKTGTVEIELDKSRFVPSKAEGGRVDLVVYLVEGVDENTDRAAGFARTLTIDFLGERLSGSVLGEVSIRDLSEAPEDALPFTDVRKTVESMGAEAN